MQQKLKVSFTYSFNCTFWSFKLVFWQGLSQYLITGGQFVPLAKILEDIFIFRGTDKLIFIRHFLFLHSYRQADKNIFLPDPCKTCNTRKVIQKRKVMLLMSNFFFSSYLNRGSMTMLYTSKHYTAESRPGNKQRINDYDRYPRVSPITSFSQKAFLP